MFTQMAGLVEQWSKLPSNMPAYHDSFISFLDALLPIQIPTLMLGKTAKFGQRTWAHSSYVRHLDGVLVSQFQLASCTAIVNIQGVNKKVEDLYHSASHINKYIFIKREIFA